MHNLPSNDAENISGTTVQLKIASYEQSMENVRSLINIALQILVALTVADVTIIGVAFSTKKAAVLAIASCSMLIGMVLHRNVRLWMISYVYSAIALEEEMLIKSLGPTWSFALMFYRYSGFYEKLQSFIERDKHGEILPVKERSDILARIAVPSWWPDHLGSYAFFFIAAVAEIVAVPVFLLLGWDFI